MATKRVTPGMATPSDVALAEETFKPMRDRAEDFQRKEISSLRDVSTAEGEALAAKERRDIAVKEADAQATSDFAKEQRGLVGKTQEKIEKHPFPTFKPTQEDATSYAQLGSMVATLGLMLGAGAKGSSKVAIGSLTGMMNGWQKGRKDLWDKEAKTFEKELQRIKLEHESIYKDLDMGMKLLATDREAGKAMLMNAAYRSGTNSVISTYINHGNLKGLYAIMQSTNKTMSTIDKNVIDSATQERRHREQLASQERARQATIEAARVKVEAKNQTLVGSVPEYVQRFTGSKLKDKEAGEIMIAANAVGDAFAIKQIISDHPEWVGRTGQIKNIFNRTIESINLGEPGPDDKGQPELIFAKRYAEYLVNYERALAGGARGFTVAFQQRFNKLLEQNQFNASGMGNLMDEQIRTITAGAAAKAPTVNRQNMIRMAYDLKARSGDDDATKGMQEIIGGSQQSENLPTETFSVDGKTYKRPRNFTDQQWSDYQKAARGKQ